WAWRTRLISRRSSSRRAIAASLLGQPRKSPVPSPEDLIILKATPPITTPRALCFRSQRSVSPSASERTSNGCGSATASLAQLIPALPNGRLVRGRPMAKAKLIAPGEQVIQLVELLPDALLAQFVPLLPCDGFPARQIFERFRSRHPGSGRELFVVSTGVAHDGIQKRCQDAS